MKAVLVLSLLGILCMKTQAADIVLPDGLEAITCTSNKDVNGRGLRVDIWEKIVQVTINSKKYGETVFTAVDDNLADGQHVLEAKSGDARILPLHVKTSNHNISVSLLSSMTIFGGKTSESGTFISNGKAAIAEMVNDDEVFTRFDIQCFDYN